MKKATISGFILFIIVVVSGFFIPIQLQAPPDVRVIVDHTKQVYVTPPCFNEADLSNYLQESNYGEAQQLGYEAESGCTTRSLVNEDVTLNKALLKLMGMAESKWSGELWNP